MNRSIGPPAPSGRVEDAEPLTRRVGDDEPRGVLETAAAIAELFWQALKMMRHAVGHHSPEIVRQAGIIAAGSLPVVLLIVGLGGGGTCGLECQIIGRQFGAETLAPAAVVLCTVREISPFIFGYIVAAKVGCGIVAELGAMRVREEVDALDTMGVRSVAYLLSTRMAAALLVLPIMYILAQAVATGTWIHVYFTFLDGADFWRVWSKGIAMVFFVLAVALYFGYRTRGGPVEVGQATARSMGVNIIGVTIINVALTIAYWGTGGAGAFPIA